MIGPPAGLFITGTDTGVGKTYVTAIIVRELRDAGVRVGACKPACSGAVFDSDGLPHWGDVDALAAALGGEFDDRLVGPQRFLAPLAPPVAARKEGKRVDALLLRGCVAAWKDRVDVLLVEGVGGLLCPLTERESVADLAGDLGYPLLIVGRLGLGTINHTLLTVEAAKARALPIAGIVLSESVDRRETASDEGASEATNPEEIAARTDVPVLGVVRFGECALRRDGVPVRMDWRAELSGTKGD
ncbi:MAG: dethiobiotin synthase [Planctomycetaceae bacterium]